MKRLRNALLYTLFPTASMYVIQIMTGNYLASYIVVLITWACEWTVMWMAFE